MVIVLTKTIQMLYRS